MGSFAETASTVTKGLVAAGVSMSIAVSLSTMSSPQGAFSMLNQFQLFILLPMIGAYIPQNVIEVILGMDLAMFSFDMIPFDKVLASSSFLDFISYDQSDDYAGRIGLTSGSSILNHLGILVIVFVLALFHLLIMPCYDASKHLDENKKTRRFLTWLWYVMTMSVYIRFGLETYLFTAISVVSELNEFDTTTDFKTFSLVVCGIFALWLMTMVIWGIYALTYITPQDSQKNNPNANDEPPSANELPQTDPTESKKWYSREFVAGLKQSVCARLYIILFMASRLAFVLLVIVFNFLPTIFKTVIF